MKKALAMALGAVLVAGSAAPASAASQVDFSGFYGLHYAVNGNLGYTGDNNLNESFFENRLQVNVKFQATDEVSVVWRFRAPRGVRWGSANNSNDAGNRAMSSHYYYGQVVQDWGTIRVGRLSNGLANVFGLANLGWSPSLDDEFTSIGVFDSSAEADSIQYANKWDNGFGLSATYSKMEARPRGTWTEPIGSDHDSDRFQIQPSYQWETGGASLNLMYQRDATSNGDPNNRYMENEDKTTTWFINPAFVQSWGAFSVHAEAMFATGTTEIVDPTKEDVDVSGQGFYLDFDYNYGPGRVNLAGWWVSGNDIEDTDDDDKAAVDLVNGFFYPLVVAYGPADRNAYYDGPSTDNRRGTLGAVGVANHGKSFLTGGDVYLNAVSTNGINIAANSIMGSIADTSAGGSPFVTQVNTEAFDMNNGNRNANHWALMISGQHAFTDEITFNYALAYMALNNPNYRVLDRATYDDKTTNTWINRGYSTQDKELGWEIDLGVNVQLLDNLAFTSTVGYMFTGDAYKQLTGYRATDLNDGGNYAIKAEWEDADDAYSWLNSLTFSF